MNILGFEPWTSSMWRELATTKPSCHFWLTARNVKPPVSVTARPTWAIWAPPIWQFRKLCRFGLFFCIFFGLFFALFVNLWRSFVISVNLPALGLNRWPDFFMSWSAKCLKQTNCLTLSLKFSSCKEFFHFSRFVRSFGTLKYPLPRPSRLHEGTKQ